MYSRSQTALWTELDGQFLLMNIETGAYYEAAGVGGEIWHLLGQPRTEAELIDHVVGKYRIDRERCASDVRAFVAKLIAVDMLFEQTSVDRDGGIEGGLTE